MRGQLFRFCRRTTSLNVIFGGTNRIAVVVETILTFFGLFSETNSAQIIDY